MQSYFLAHFCYRDTDQNNFPTLWENDKLFSSERQKNCKMSVWALCWYSAGNRCVWRESCVSSCREAIASGGGGNPGSSSLVVARSTEECFSTVLNSDLQ